MFAMRASMWPGRSYTCEVYQLNMVSLILVEKLAVGNEILTVL